MAVTVWKSINDLDGENLAECLGAAFRNNRWYYCVLMDWPYDFTPSYYTIIKPPLYAVLSDQEKGA